MHWYFAYGSNLDLSRMLRRCPTARVVGPAHLPGAAIRFAGRSRHWNAGTATVVSGEGEVSGLLYALDDDALRRLDAFEGVPTAYVRTRREVVTERGARVEAEVYARSTVVAACAPDPDYVRLMIHGLRRWGLSLDAVLAATRSEEPDLAGDERAVFVYGTLMRGERNAMRMGRARLLRMARTRSEFALLDLGPYPALVPGTGTVFGEVYAVDRSTLEALDVFEAVPELYRREQMLLMDGRGAEVYVFASAPQAPAIPGGDWRWHLRRESIQGR